MCIYYMNAVYFLISAALVYANSLHVTRNAIKFMDKLHVRCSYLKGQNPSQNASERASNLTEICFRPGLCLGPTGGLSGPQTPCLLCFHIVIGLATPLITIEFMDWKSYLYNSKVHLVLVVLKYVKLTQKHIFNNWEICTEACRWHIMKI